MHQRFGVWGVVWNCKKSPTTVAVERRLLPCADGISNNKATINNTYEWRGVYINVEVIMRVCIAGQYHTWGGGDGGGTGYGWGLHVCNLLVTFDVHPLWKWSNWGRDQLSLGTASVQWTWCSKNIYNIQSQGGEMEGSKVSKLHSSLQVTTITNNK